jgi:hypothetical protein
MRSGRELWRADVLNPRKAGNYRIIPSSLIALDDSYTLASPVIVGNRIYIRTGEHLYCLAQVDSSATP